MDAVRYVGRGYGANYHAILFRRNYPDLEKSLIKVSYSLYPLLGASYNEGKKLWRFPGGELVQFGHMDLERDVFNYQSAEFQFIGFDELTHFSENQYLYLFSRCRSSKGVRLRMRAATNPGGDGHDWVFRRWGPWLDPECPTKAQPGDELWCVRDNDIDRVVQKGTKHAMGRTFIPARLEDNPSLFEDGQYESQLMLMPLVDRERLRNGNWLIKPAKGLYFNRAWLRFVDAAEVPIDVKRYRYWDRAATEATKGKDPDWTSGAKVAIDKDGRIFIEDVAFMRGNPGEVQNFILSTAELDGLDIPIGLEQEPGSSGKADVAAYIRLLNKFSVKAFNKRIKKIVAAGPISAQTLAKNVHMVRGKWNEPVIQQLEQFPEGSHDDHVDSISGAYSALVDSRVPYQGWLDLCREDTDDRPKTTVAEPANGPTILVAPGGSVGTAMAKSGTPYLIRAGRIEAKAADVESLLAIGFERA